MGQKGKLCDQKTFAKICEFIAKNNLQITDDHTKDSLRKKVTGEKVDDHSSGEQTLVQPKTDSLRPLEGVAVGLSWTSSVLFRTWVVCQSIGFIVCALAWASLE